MQNSFDFSQYLKDLRQKQSAVLRRITEAQAEATEIQNQIEQAEKTVMSYCAFYDQEPPAELSATGGEFEGLSIKASLVLIARRNGGLLNVTQARKMLVAAGIFRDERNASTSMGAILSRNSQMFAHVTRGVYRLKEETPEEKDWSYLFLDEVSNDDESDTDDSSTTEETTVSLDVAESDNESESDDDEDDEDDEDEESEDEEDEDFLAYTKSLNRPTPQPIERIFDSEDEIPF